MNQASLQVDKLAHFLTDEIIQAVGMPVSGRLHSILETILHLPTSRFARLAVDFDDKVAEVGFIEAVRWVLPNFVNRVNAWGVENIPKDGPLLVVSNHPGTCDSLVVVAQIQRSDLKVVATGIPFTRGLHSTAQHLIYTARKDVYARMRVVREAIRHLAEGGAVLIFPGGKIEPDPAILPGAEQELEHWSPSMELMLRRVPQAQVLVSIISGVLSREWMRYPLVYLKKKTLERQRIAEFLQVIQWMVFPDSKKSDPLVSFSQPLLAADLVHNASRDMFSSLIARAKDLLEVHIELMDYSSSSHFSTPLGS